MCLVLFIVLFPRFCIYSVFLLYIFSFPNFFLNWQFFSYNFFLFQSLLYWFLTMVPEFPMLFLFKNILQEFIFLNSLFWILNHTKTHIELLNYFLHSASTLFLWRLQLLYWLSLMFFESPFPFVSLLIFHVLLCLQMIVYTNNLYQ